jgi:putative heme-binding domain-containing protein
MVDVVPPAVRISRFVSQRAGASEEKRIAAGSAPSSQQAELRGFPIPSRLTMARGPVIYRGNLFAGEYSESVFVADPVQHTVHHVALQDTPLGRIAVGTSAEPRAEFLMSSDSAFHPMQVVLGPEGGLYIADFHGGNGSGRIYRVVPVAFQQPKALHLKKASTHDLVVYQSSPNGWLADTASRLLYERRDAAAIPMLSRTIGFSPVPNAKIRALHTLDAIGALKEPDVLKGLQDADDGVREHGVRLSVSLVKGGAVSDALWNQLKGLVTDRSARVRYQLAFTLGNIVRPDRARVLAQLPRTDFANPWMQTAILSSSVDQGANLFVILAADSRVRLNPQGKEFLRQLATMIGIEGRMAEVNQVIDFIDRTQLEPEPALAFLYGLGEGLYRGRSSLALVDPQGRLQRFYVQAASVAIDDSLVESIRLEGIRLLRVSPNNFSDLNDLLLLLFGSNQPQAVQSSTIVTLARFENPGIVPALIQRWSLLTPALRAEAISALLIRHERIPTLLDAVERGLISGADFPSDAIDYLCTNGDMGVRQRALRLFGMPPERRPDVIQAYQPALRLQGTPSQGRQIFLSRCASCHKLGNEGQSFGPDLIAAKSYGRQSILESIIEPNAHVLPADTSVVLDTKGGDTLLGIVEEENPTTIILKRPRGYQAVWRLDNIDGIHPQPWSFMPNGLEQGLSTQSMADLLEYIMTFPR